MNQLFESDTYEGCRIRHPDLDTLIVEGVRGTPLAIRFQKIIQDWEVELRVSVRASLDAGEWKTFLIGQPLTSQHKKFWHMLQWHACRQRVQENNELLNHAHAVITTGSADKSAE